MHCEGGMAFADRRTKTNVQLDTSRFCIRCAGKFRHARQPAAVDAIDRSGDTHINGSRELCRRWLTHAALRLANPLKLGPGSSAAQAFGRHEPARAVLCNTAELQQRRRYG